MSVYVCERMWDRVYEYIVYMWFRVWLCERVWVRLSLCKYVRVCIQYVNLCLTKWICIIKEYVDIFVYAYVSVSSC